MKMHDIFTKTVIGRQIHAAAEPEYRCEIRLILGRMRDEIAHVHVCRRAVWVARVHDQRHTHGFVGAAGQFGAVRRRRGR